MLATSDLEYTLPERLIATRPIEPRDQCRLLVVSRSDPDRLEHRRFSDLPGFLNAGDGLLVNSSAVIPARLFARREDSGGRVEGLFLDEPDPGIWIVMLKSNGKLRPGQRLTLHTPQDESSAFKLELQERVAECWRVQLVPAEGPDDRVPAAVEVLEKVGSAPLPPYIVRARKEFGQTEIDEHDRAWYQTVYARPTERGTEHSTGSVAAPTAGLHFTPALLNALRAQGVWTDEVTLHVGAGTFKPIDAEHVEEHPMHEEAVSVSARTVQLLERKRDDSAKRVLVGTTTVRDLESLPDPLTAAIRESGWHGRTDLLISPGFTFRFTDALITNFHLPRSTLLALVAALLPEGIERLKDIYQTAIDEEYRFYSYGDAMLILP